MDQGTQQNAAMVEQSTAASHGLAEQAAALNALLAQFKLGTETRSAIQPARAAAHAPAPSPARALGHRIASAFGGGAAAARKQEEWDEF
jgi:methyl-accepting chemotaxis protein